MSTLNLTAEKSFINKETREKQHKGDLICFFDQYKRESFFGNIAKIGKNKKTGEQIIKLCNLRRLNFMNEYNTDKTDHKPKEKFIFFYQTEYIRYK